MFTTYNYFRQYNEGKKIESHKEFYKQFSNTREFGGEFSHIDHLVKSRFFSTFGHMLNIFLRKRPSKVLDIGCGNGVNLPLSLFMSADREKEYFAVDYAEKTIETARRSYPNINFDVMDAFDLQFEDNSFDISIISSVLILYEQEMDRVRLLKEASRVTKMSNGGCVVAIVWKDSFLLKLSVVLSKYIAKFKGIPLPEDFMGIHFTEKEARSMFDRAGLKVKEVIHTGEMYGLLESIRYLNCKKYKRTFGKQESEAGYENPQNIYEDLIQTSGTFIFAKPMYCIAKYFPSLFQMFSVYVLQK